MSNPLKFIFTFLFPLLIKGARFLFRQVSLLFSSIYRILENEILHCCYIYAHPSLALKALANRNLVRFLSYLSFGQDVLFVNTVVRCKETSSFAKKLVHYLEEVSIQIWDCIIFIVSIPTFLVSVLY